MSSYQLLSSGTQPTVREKRDAVAVGRQEIHGHRAVMLSNIIPDR